VEVGKDDSMSRRGYIQERFNPHDVNGAAGEGSLLQMVEKVILYLFHWCYTHLK
jgi:hypothetical protein